MRPFILRSFILLLVSVAFLNSVKAQTETQNDLTLEEIVSEFLLGEGIDAFNITYNGFDGDQIYPRVGTFTSEGAGFPFEEGMLMTTKNVQIATCGAGTDGSGGGSDADLSQIVSGGLNDVTVVEFDFIPSGDSVQFNFIFASREYNGFVCSGFNDVFGFFISGPGIDGTFSLDAENIATLPNGTPVSINSVNNGANGEGAPCNSPGNPEPCPCNAEFFINNGSGNGTGLNSDICFGGYTTPITAQATVICGEVYHMKLAIANVGDGALDSGVFLEKGSFISNLIVDLDINPVVPGFELGDNDFIDGLVAGCTNAQFCLYRPDTLGTDTAVFELSGSAIPGVHYIAPESNLVIFPPGVDTVCVDIVSLATGLGAQIDSLVVTAVSINACGDTVTTSSSIDIYNEYDFPVTTTNITVDCPTPLVDLSGSASGGVPQYTYVWTLPDSTTVVGEGQSIPVEPPPPGSTDEYILMVTDGCGLSPEYASITVTNNVQPDPVVTTSPNDTINCVGQTVDLTANGSLGQGELDYLWSTNETTTEITVAPDGSQTITWYFVTVTDECGISANDSVAVYFIPLEAPTALPGNDVTVVCAGDEVILTGAAEGGAAPYEYQWLGFDPGAQITVNPMITTTYTLIVTDDCGGTSEPATVEVNVPVYDPLTINLPEPTSTCPGDAQNLSASVSGGAGGFVYLWDDGSDTPSINVSPVQTTLYSVTVTDVCGTSTTASTTVNVPIYGPIEASIASQPVCTGLSITLTVPSISGGAGQNPQDYTYQWEGPGTFGNVSATGSVTVNDAEEGVYTVLITDVCGNSFTGEVISTLTSVADIPNVITPNNDNKNDEFVVPNSSVFTTKVTILDRWGKVVYETDNYNCDVSNRQICWDAKDDKGDVYFYMIDIDNGLCTFQGTVHVLE